MKTSFLVSTNGFYVDKLHDVFNTCLLFCFLIVSVAAHAQEEQPAPYHIRTIQWATQVDNPIPVFELGTPIQLQFDDISAREEDYYYRITHHDYDWSPSDLSKVDYMEGYDDVRIRDYVNSYNTLQAYSHYNLRIPNQFTTRLKVSGNYMLSIYDDNSELLFSKAFMIYEPIAQVGVQIKRSRDLNTINTKQSVQFFVDSQSTIFQDPDRNLKIAIVQNGNLTRAIRDIKPQFNLANRQVYKYDAETSFWAANEYLNFDNSDYRSPNISIDYVNLKDIYNNYLFTDLPRTNVPYTYNPDINGNFQVNTIRENDDAYREAEYVWVHFALAIPQVESGEIHVFGNWNGFQTTDDSVMAFNEDTQRYEVRILFKQGFYNYRYIHLEDDEINDGFVSGNFHQTENTYTVLAYYRNPGARYDRLVGVGTGNSINITN